MIFTPDTIDIIKDNPDTRRKFLNMLISSLRPNYIHLMNNYKKVLIQRNNFLRQIKIDNKLNNILDIWDEQLVELSYQIYEYRKKYIDKFSEKINNIHKKITKCGNCIEEIKIQYYSDSYNKDEFLKKLKINRDSDIKKGFTSFRDT
ncbi:MAG: DNA replication/repair protein RecF [Clostridia bacterium]|nr:DNA replication/repair protein RecF [Clostridia bacterium]